MAVPLFALRGRNKFHIPRVFLIGFFAMSIYFCCVLVFDIAEHEQWRVCF